MDMNHLFSASVKELKLMGVPDVFREDPEDVLMVPSMVSSIERIIKQSYASNGEDVEDLGDVVCLLEESLYTIIDNKKYDRKSVGELVRLWVYAKKRTSQKVRDHQNDGRNYWNCEEASRQYHEFLTYRWAPSRIKMKKLLEERFGSM